MLKRSFVRYLFGLLILAGMFMTAALADAEVIKVDQAIAPYAKVSGISGNLSSVGSDTLNNLMTYWAESFKKQYPSVIIQIEGKGSATAPPALVAGTAQLGPMSRPMKTDEIEAFEKKYGFKPLQIGVALDALAVFVNKDNPLEKMTFPQIDGIFSKTYKAFSKSRQPGAAKDISTWGDLALAGDWAGKPISLYGRNSASGTYAFFKEHVMDKGDFKDTVKEQPGSASVVQGVASDLAGIGYSGIGYVTSGVKPLSLAAKENGEAFAPTYANVLRGKYPLGRMLFVYVAKAPGKPLDPAVKEFLKFVLSKEGQETVVKDGYLPLPAKVVAEQLARLEK